MFSLDDETLEKGGDGILASKGDLGELLFSASAGLADLSRKLVDLKGEADRFYKFRARSGQLADLKTRLSDLKASREQFDTLATEYARLIEVRDRASTQYDQAIAERTRIQTRTDEIHRHLSALPRLSVLRGLREQLSPLANLPMAPPSWSRELPELQREEIQLGVQTQSISDEVERLANELDAIVVDDPCEGIRVFSASFIGSISGRAFAAAPLENEAGRERAAQNLRPTRALALACLATA